MTEREIIAKEWRDEKGLLHRREVGQELVRCKDCKRWWGNHYHDNEDGKCPMDAWIDGDGFCSYGERMTERSE